MSYLSQWTRLKHKRPGVASSTGTNMTHCVCCFEFWSLKDQAHHMLISVCFKQKHWKVLVIATRRYRWPVILQSSRKVGVPVPGFVLPPLSGDLDGRGIVIDIGWWNLRCRGSIVTMGLTDTRSPRTFVTSSSSIGWAWIKTKCTQSSATLHISVFRQIC